MKAQDLRVGNWVISKRFNTPVVLELGDFGEAYAHADGSDSLEWFETHLSPIPLTEERLLKFGFQENDGEYSIENIRYNLLKTKTYEGFLFCDGQNCLTAILYVHQLQNLFFALTGEELKLKE